MSVDKSEPLDKGTVAHHWVNETPIENLVRTLLLPRLDQLEVEVKMLRELAWPVCQSLKEKGNPLSCSEEKRRYFRILYKDEALDLLEKKAKFTGITSPEIIHQEYDLILLESLNNFPNQDIQNSCNQVSQAPETE